MQSVPPRGSGWVRSQCGPAIVKLRTHPLPRGGTDCIQVPKYKEQSTKYNYGVTPTTGLNFTEAPSLFVRKRMRGAVEETVFDA
jgi:hypothetical protein